MEEKPFELSSNNNSEVMLDADEYFFKFPKVFEKDPNVFPIEQKQNWYKVFDNKNYLRKVYSYYFQTRASISVTVPNGKIDKELNETIRKYAINWSEYLASRSFLENEILTPYWIDLTGEVLSKHPNPLVVSAWSNLEIILIDTPTIQTGTEFSDGRYTLSLPILLRTFFKQMITGFANLRQVTFIERNYNKDQFTTNVALIKRSFLAYCWFIRDEFHPISIPYPHFYSGDTVFYASHIAFLQTMIIIIHELAHIVLGHMDGTWTRTNIPVQITDSFDISVLSDADIMELEADVFAIENLLLLKDYDIDNKIFAVLSLMDYMQMFTATSSLKINDDENAENTVKYGGIMLYRRKLANNLLGALWSHEGERLTNLFFHNILVNNYLIELKSVKNVDINEFVDRRHYLVMEDN